MEIYLKKAGLKMWVGVFCVVYDRDQWRFIVNTEAGSGLMWYRMGPVAFYCKQGSWIWIDVVQNGTSGVSL